MSSSLIFARKTLPASTLPSLVAALWALSCLPAKADPICFMDMPDGSRLVLNGMCGREPIAPTKPGLTLDNFRRLQPNQTTYEQAVQILGGEGVLLSSGGESSSFSTSVEVELYEWTENEIKITLSFSKRYGKLVLFNKRQIGLQADSKDIAHSQDQLQSNSINSKD